MTRLLQILLRYDKHSNEVVTRNVRKIRDIWGWFLCWHGLNFSKLRVKDKETEERRAYSKKILYWVRLGKLHSRTSIIVGKPHLLHFHSTWYDFCMNLDICAQFWFLIVQWSRFYCKSNVDIISLHRPKPLTDLSSVCIQPITLVLCWFVEYLTKHLLQNY